MRLLAAAVAAPGPAGTKPGMATPDNAPRPSPDMVEPGIPATEEVSAEALTTGDPGEGSMPMPDRPMGVTAWGTTPAEEERGEPVADRVRHEVPDTPRTPDEPLRQLVQDDDRDVYAAEDAVIEDTLTSEEAAVHATPERR